MNRSSLPPRRVPITAPSFDQSEEKLVCQALRSGWVTQGPRVAEFEKRVAEYVGVRDAVAVTSATAALFLSLHALGIGPGDEVIVPSLSFIASANAVVHAGATPVFVDADPATLNVDPDAIEPAVTDRTRAIMPVDQLGRPAPMDRINEIAARHRLAVVEDAACAIGSVYRGKPVGGGATAACFSFHPRKVIVTGEGGMITTDDPQLAAKLRLLRHQGMSVSDLQRHQADHVIIEQYPQVGYNFRLSDVLAAIGVAQMAKLDGFVNERRRLAVRYDAALGEVDATEVYREPAHAACNYQSYIVRLRGAAAETRNRLLDELQRRGVASRRGLMAIHHEPCYRDARISGGLHHTEAATDQTLILPMYPGLTDDDQDYVIAQLRDALPAVGAPAQSPAPGAKS